MYRLNIMENTKSILSHADEMRLTYLGAVPHTLFTSFIWFISGLLGTYSKPTAILFFIIGGTFIFPGGELLRKLMQAPNCISRENKLKQFFMLLAFTIPLSYPLVYLAIQANVNYFFPAFMILIGAHYLPFVFGYRMKTFALLSILLVILGTIISVVYPMSFSIPAYLTSAVLLLFAIIHFIKIKNEII